MKYKVIFRDGSEKIFKNAPEAAKAYFLDEYGKEKTEAEPYLPDLHKLDNAGNSTWRVTICWSQIAQPVEK